jgi:hypothetical protein
VREHTRQGPRWHGAAAPWRWNTGHLGLELLLRSVDRDSQPLVRPGASGERVGWQWRWVGDRSVRVGKGEA